MSERKSGFSHLFANETATRKLVFWGALLLITLVCLPYLGMPPVWDAASGAFAPAAHLYQNGSLGKLLALPGYQVGGPNTDTLSLYTALVYASMNVFQGKAVLFIPFLHVLSVFAAALIVYGFYLALRKILEREEAALSCLILATFPLFLVQASYIYMEIFGALFSVLSLWCYVERRYWTGSLCTLMALSMKALGLFTVAGFVAMLAMDYLLGARSKKIVLNLVLVTLGAIAIALMNLHFRYSIPAVGGYSDYFRSVISYLVDIPDLFVFVILAPVSMIVFAVSNIRQGLGGLPNRLMESSADRVVLAAGVYSLAFISFLLTIGLIGTSFFPLLRYYIWVVPELFICFVYLLWKAQEISPYRFRKPLFFISVMSLTIFFTLNNAGRFYPWHGKLIRSFSVVERSFEYVNFFNAQKTAADYVDKYFPELPVYVARPEYYFMSSPLIGYVKKDIKDLRLVINLGAQTSLPDKFVVVSADSNGYQGQPILDAIVKSVISAGTFSVQVFRSQPFGPYSSSVFVITAKKAK